MEQFIHYWSVGAAGAAAFEVLKVYELRGKLEQKRYQALIRSVWFWLSVVGMVSASGFFSWAYCSDISNSADNPNGVSNWQLVIVAIAARSIGRSAIEAFVSNERNTLGEEDDDFDIKDAFR